MMMMSVPIANRVALTFFLTADAEMHTRPTGPVFVVSLHNNPRNTKAALTIKK